MSKSNRDFILFIVILMGFILLQAFFLRTPTDRQPTRTATQFAR